MKWDLSYWVLDAGYEPASYEDGRPVWARDQVAEWLEAMAVACDELRWSELADFFRRSAKDLGAD
jgi:hypothetical protein